jgi:hypothetical protein
MIKVIWQMLLGFLLIDGGFYLGFLFIRGEQNGGSPFFLIISIPIIALGAFFIIRAAKADDVVIARKDKSIKEITLPGALGKEGFGKVLKRNDELNARWTKTNETRDKLKMAQVRAAEENEPKPQ